MSDKRPLLFVDTASPVVSVALRAGEGVTERLIETRRTAEQLLPTLHEMLQHADIPPRELAGIVAMQGPGSFTGLRIGLATVLGLHQALELPATAIPILPVLGLAGSDQGGEVTAAVDAIRGDWFVQSFNLDGESGKGGSDRLLATSEAGLKSGTELLAESPRRVLGFGVDSLAQEPGFRPEVTQLSEPPPLAGVAARRLRPADIAWQASRLIAPIYFRPPAATLPRS